MHISIAAVEVSDQPALKLRLAGTTKAKLFYRSWCTNSIDFECVLNLKTKNAILTILS